MFIVRIMGNLIWNKKSKSFNSQQFYDLIEENY